MKYLKIWETLHKEEKCDLKESKMWTLRQQRASLQQSQPNLTSNFDAPQLYRHADSASSSHSSQVYAADRTSRRSRPATATWSPLLSGQPSLKHDPTNKLELFRQFREFIARAAGWPDMSSQYVLARGCFRANNAHKLKRCHSHNSVCPPCIHSLLCWS